MKHIYALKDNFEQHLIAIKCQFHILFTIFILTKGNIKSYRLQIKPEFLLYRNR